jgi:putative MFS transporter
MASAVGVRQTAAGVQQGIKTSNNYFDGLAVTGLHKGIFYIIMLSYFFEQLDNWNFGFIAPALVQTWGLTMTDIGHVNSVYYVCMTLGGFLGGVISDFIGRRKTFLLSIAVFSIASVLNGLTNDFHIFTLSRGLTGFGVFCLMVCSQAYIAEMAPAESRGKWQGLVAAAGFSAVPVVGVLSRVVIPMHPDGWRWIFYLGGLGLIGFAVGLKYLKESPRWLVAKGRLHEAEEVVRSISGRSIDLSAAASKIPAHVRAVDVLIGMFRREYIKRTLVLMTAFILTTPAAFVLAAWTPTLLKAKGFSLEDSLMASMIIMVGVPVGCYFSSLISDKGGRKTPIMAVSIVAGLLGFLFATRESFVEIVILGFVITALIMAISFMMFSYAAESYPTRMRNTATGLHNGIARLSVAAFQVLIPIIFAKYSFSGVFNVFGVMMILPMLVVGLWGARTSGKALEDIQ